MIKKTISGEKATAARMEAAQMLYGPVSSTLGPKGKNVIINPYQGMARSTKDGVTVAGEIESADPFVNGAIKIIRQVAMKTVEDAGDGTTTATILVYHIINEIQERLSKGENILEIRAEIQADLQQAVAQIRSIAIPLITEEGFNIEKLKQIATTSANNDEGIGELFAQAYKIIGPTGTVILNRTERPETYIEASSGMRQERGYESKEFSTAPEKCDYDTPVFFVTDKYLTSQKELMKIVSYTHENNLPLIIICLDIKGEALTFLNANKLQKNLRVTAVTFPQYWRPDFKEVIEDIAIYTGATFCTDANGYNIDNITAEQVPGLLGSAVSFISTPKDCIIVAGSHTDEAIIKRLGEIKAKITPEEGASVKERLLSRGSSLSGGVATLYAGGQTAAERGETADRCDDAILAVRSALEEGYIPGAGKVYLMCAKALKDGIIARSLPSIINKICENADIDAKPIIEQMSLSENPNYGYNAKTDKLEDLVIAGVLDSAKVARVALENAVSVALLFLNNDYLVGEFKD
jgi:chaperonin GroEL